MLPAKTKDLVKALVMVRSSTRRADQGMGLAGKRDDLIAGKGNGLIMLLHGGPGTGKTLTAGTYRCLHFDRRLLTLCRKVASKNFFQDTAF